MAEAEVGESVAVERENEKKKKEATAVEEIGEEGGERKGRVLFFFFNLHANRGGFKINPSYFPSLNH